MNDHDPSPTPQGPHRNTGRPRYLEVEMLTRFILEIRSENGAWIDLGLLPRRL